MKDLLSLYLPVEPGLCSKERAIVVGHDVGAWWLDLGFQQELWSLLQGQFMCFPFLKIMDMIYHCSESSKGPFL